jgi:MazG family protein
MSDKIKQILENNLAPFQRLVAIMALLRSEQGCAWDRKQTHQSLLPYLIEEAYETAEAIESGDMPHLKEELGDLMIQIVFHAQIASERGDFDLDDSINTVNEKLIRRHPHVFDKKADLAPQEVRDQWERIKVESGEKKSVLGGLPRSMPALLMAFRIGEKAGGVGFDWKAPADVIAKLDEEIGEIRAEIDSENKEAIADEIGDLLFATASLARKVGVDPELALKKALAKFTRRFEKLEEWVRNESGSFGGYSLEQLEEIWQRVK